jgi:hypothetical protein
VERARLVFRDLRGRPVQPDRPGSMGLLDRMGFLAPRDSLEWDNRESWAPLESPEPPVRWEQADFLGRMGLWVPKDLSAPLALQGTLEQPERLDPRVIREWLLLGQRARRELWEFKVLPAPMDSSGWRGLLAPWELLEQQVPPVSRALLAGPGERGQVEPQGLWAMPAQVVRPGLMGQQDPPERRGSDSPEPRAPWVHTARQVL